MFLYVQHGSMGKCIMLHVRGILILHVTKSETCSL